MVDSGSGFEAIAIIGMAGRFPGAADLRAFWDNLIDGRESLTEFSVDEIVASGIPRDTLIEHRRRTRGVLDGATEFDAGFFGYSPREAEIMDPQQRVFLEVAWESMEDAGYDSDRVPGPVGVYAGSGINTYFPANVETRPDVIETFGRFGATILNEKDFLSTRVAYAMDLKGPAITVQTACSTSLVAVCYAAQGLLNFECDVAIAGGVSAVFPQTHSSIHEEGGMISTDGHCRPFDENASGTLFSDGAGAVVLRRLSDAIADGDQIRAIIRGFAVNNDGAGKAGFTAPSVNGQAEVIQMAQELAGVSPETISYIEAHGTATRLGDPIEIAGLTKAFRVGTDRTEYCAIGSVKSNIGHLDAAAGVAGLIKTTLALEHATIPATLHFEQPTSQVDWPSTPFHVIDTTTPWPESSTPRRAGVSSFGIGGTNAHVVVEEAPTLERSPLEPRSELLVLSARSTGALDVATERLAAHLAESDHELRDVAYTLQNGRQVFGHRRAVVVHDGADASDVLSDPSSRRVVSGSTSHRRKPVVFMFSGQGSQYVDMGKDLYDSEPVFRSTVDRCAAILQPLLGLDLRTIMYPEAGTEEIAAEQLRQTGTTQPALFVIEYALAAQWQAWGVEPTAMVGHSIGEYVAACLAEVFTLENALALVAARGRLMESLPAGSMVSVPLTEDQATPFLDDGTCVSVINSEGMVVVSGDFAGIGALEERLAAQGIEARRLQTSHAFHSPMMDPILDEFRTEVIKAQPLSPRTPILSNVTGTWMTDQQAIDPDYWAQHLRRTVRFSDCLSTLLEQPDAVFVEVGPGRTLTSLVRMHNATTADTDVIASTRHPDQAADDRDALLEGLGRLWVAGGAIDWPAVTAGAEPRRVSLPTYPFEHEDYWLAPGVPAGYDAPQLVGGPTSTDMPARAPDGRLAAAAVAADNGYQAMLTTLWEDLLGVEGIRPDEDFFELGGTSLIAARMLALVGNRTGVHLPLSALVTSPTAAALASTLHEQDFGEALLVDLQPGDGSTPTLFVIHPEGGHLLAYRELAASLGPAWSVKGLQARGINGGSAPSSSVIEMASTYVDEIRTVQPQGPYFLAGWCLGGTIALEMAHQITEAGDEVAWLGMIQARHPGYWTPIRTAPGARRLRWRIADTVEFESAAMSALSASSRFEYVRKRTRHVLVRTRAGMPSDKPRAAHLESQAIANACGAAHHAAYWAYEPPPYAGHVVLVRSDHQPRGVAEDPTLGWGTLLTGDVELFEVPSFHKTIMSGPAASRTATIFTESIASVLSARAGNGEVTW